MSQDVNPRFMRILALGFASAPVGFGALRALTTGTDFRYLVTALASLAIAATIFRLGGSHGASRWLLLWVALPAATLIGGAVAFAQGAASAPAVLAVSFGFGLCVTAGGVLGLFGRPGNR